jgi:hypothetical protein
MMFGGRCAYCGCDLPEKGWHSDHVAPIYRDWKWGVSKDGSHSVIISTGTCRNPENEDVQFPSCAPCNRLKSVLSVEEFRSVVQNRILRLRQSSGNFRHAERFDLVTVNDEPVVFWFEEYRQQQAQAA